MRKCFGCEKDIPDEELPITVKMKYRSFIWGKRTKEVEICYECASVFRSGDYDGQKPV